MNNYLGIKGDVSGSNWVQRNGSKTPDASIKAERSKRLGDDLQQKATPPNPNFIRNGEKPPPPKEQIGTAQNNYQRTSSVNRYGQRQKYAKGNEGNEDPKPHNAVSRGFLKEENNESIKRSSSFLVATPAQNVISAASQSKQGNNVSFENHNKSFNLSFNSTQNTSNSRAFSTELRLQQRRKPGNSSKVQQSSGQDQILLMYQSQYNPSNEERHPYNELSNTTQIISSLQNKPMINESNKTESKSRLKERQSKSNNSSLLSPFRQTNINEQIIISNQATNEKIAKAQKVLNSKGLKIQKVKSEIGEDSLNENLSNEPNHLSNRRLNFQNEEQANLFIQIQHNFPKNISLFEDQFTQVDQQNQNYNSFQSTSSNLNSKISHLKTTSTPQANHQQLYSINLSKDTSSNSQLQIPVEKNQNIEEMHFHFVEFQQNCKKWLQKIEKL